MNLNFEFIYNNQFDNYNFNVINKNCKDIINIISKKYNKLNKYIYIYENNKLLDNKFNNWNIDNNYIIIINNQFINIIVKFNNKSIKLPQLNINTKINEIKNILSIKEDIFLQNIKLKNKNTLHFYKIKNNTILSTNYVDALISTF